METPHGHGKECEHCGKPCDAFAGDPSLWPTPLFSKVPGVVCYWHMWCVSKRLRQIEALEAMCRAAGYSDMQIAAGTPYVELMGS